TQYARGMEETIGSNLDALQKKIGDAASAMGKASQQDTLARAADKTRDLVRGIESLDQRMRERSQNGRGQNGQRSQNGQQSANGQQGSQGSQSAQGSQNGGNAQSGQPGGANANGGWNNGAPYGPYGGGDARNWGGGYYYGGWSADDVRQWRREYREWVNDAEALRRQLQAGGVNPRDLDEIIRDLQKFDNDKVFVDPRGLELLQAAALE